MKDGAMKEHDAPTEPRWKTAGEPYLLTRDELIAELDQRGVRVTDRQLKSWATHGLLPPPIRRLPARATDGKPRALHPFWVIGFIPDLLGRLRAGHGIKKLVRYAQAQWDQWEKRESALLSYPSVGVDSEEQRQLYNAMSQAVYAYTKYYTQTTGQRILNGTINLSYENGHLHTIAIGGYRPGDENTD
jgi:hypothetical protein